MRMVRTGSGGTREYPWPVLTMLNAINDLIELQRGEVTFDDIQHGKISFRVEMYGFSWEYQFVVTALGTKRSRVLLEIDGEATNKALRVKRQLELLNSMLAGSGGTGVEN